MFAWAALLLSLVGLACAQPLQLNFSVPNVIPHTPVSSLTQRWGPGCGSDVHSVASHQSPKSFYQVGGLYYPGWNAQGVPQWTNSIDYSTSAAFLFTSTSTIVPTSFSFNTSAASPPFNPTSRVTPGVVVLPSGALLVMGGKIASNWNLQNDVIMTTNSGVAWSQVTAAAPWSARSDMSVAIQPTTTIIVLCGGEIPNFVYQQDCWLSTDGLGAVWKQQPTPIWPATQQAPMAFMYDGTSTTAATLVMYNPSNNYAYSSTNWAQSWTQLGMFPQGWPQQTGRMAADAENYLYVAGGVNEGSQIFFSSNKGATWSLMNQITYYPGARIADAVTVGSFQYGCLAINYITSPSVPGGYRKQLLEYGGQLQCVADLNTWLNCSFTSSSLEVTSVINEIIIPGETIATAAEGYTPTSPNFVGNAGLVFHNATQSILTWRNYPDCTYNVHAAANRSSNVQSWQFGGFTASWSYIPTLDYSPYGTWNTYQLITPTYSGGTVNPNFNGSAQTGKVAAGVAMLFNGMLMLFGGKDAYGNSTAPNIGVTNDVFISTNNGQSWTMTCQMAPWLPRSDMAVAVMPGTNYVVMGGGQTNPNYLNIADFWINQDGQGAIWTAGAPNPAFGPFQDAACVFTYDNKYVNPISYGSQSFSTLLINTGVINPALNQDSVYKSVDGGMTFTLVTIAPWVQRLRNNFVADMENYVYMSGGNANIGGSWVGNFGDVWVSTDFGNTWAMMLQTPQTPGPYNNIFTFQGAQENCMVLRYFQNPNSPNGYHKQLVLFGSPNLISVAQQSAPECVMQQSVNVVYAEIMFQSELSNPAFVDTTVTPPPSNTVPTLNLNGPSALMPQRLYPACAYDVHAVLANPPYAPQSYALGGTDPDYIALPSLDTFSGSNVAGFSTITPTFNAGYAKSSLSRWAGGAAVLGNGILLWMGGKLPNFAMANDVWYSSDKGNTFYSGSQVAPWTARSDMAVAPFPGTNCVMLAMGYSWSVSGFNDIWTSCDGYGATWMLQNAAAPWPGAQDPSVVALYDNGAPAGSANLTSTVIIYSSSDQMIHFSNNMGATWTAGVEAPWSARGNARFLADTSNYVYLIGGTNSDATAIAGQIVVQPDCWFSWNKGQNWIMLQQQTTAGYNYPVTLQLTDYSCVSMNVNGGHNQLVAYAGDIHVYNNMNQVAIGTWWNQPLCTCTSQTGVKSVFMDLIAPGETPNNLPASSSGSSSNTFSRGATAGIAVGVGVGCMILCCVLLAFAYGAGILTGSAGKGKSADFSSQSATAPHKKFENEPSNNTSAVELNETSGQA